MQSSVRTSNDHGFNKFFRSRLLTLDAEEISKLVEKLDQEADQVRSQCFKLAWYMRGGATYDQILQLGSKERTMINELAKENIETTKKTGMMWV